MKKELSVRWWSEKLGCSKSQAGRLLEAFGAEYGEPDEIGDVETVREFARRRALHSNRWFDSPFRDTGSDTLAGCAGDAVTEPPAPRELDGRDEQSSNPDAELERALSGLVEELRYAAPGAGSEAIVMAAGVSREIGVLGAALEKTLTAGAGSEALARPNVANFIRIDMLPMLQRLLCEADQALQALQDVKTRLD